ncbi:hypothetical protein Unana1_01081 [Umbelopsis nana]
MSSENANDLDTFRDDRGRSPLRRSRSRSPVERRDRDAGRSRSRSRPRSPPPPPEDHDTNPGDNLFITGLSYKTASADLEELFNKYGKVQKAEVIYDPHTRESRGFAFIRMNSAEDADRCVDSLNGMLVDGRAITVEKAKRSRPRTPTPGRYYGPPKRDSRGRPERVDRRYEPAPYYDRYDRDPRPSRYDRYDQVMKDQAMKEEEATTDTRETDMTDMTETGAHRPPDMMLIPLVKDLLTRHMFQP